MNKLSLRPLSLLVLCVLPGLAQADSGPSLEVTMKFIQDALDASKELFTVSTESATSFSWTSTVQFHYIQQLTANSSDCAISGYEQNQDDKRIIGPFPLRISLKAVEEWQISTQTQSLNPPEKAVGIEWISSTPELVVVRAATLASLANNMNLGVIRFGNQELANRVVNALKHATELCGGGHPLFNSPAQTPLVAAQPQNPQVYQPPPATQPGTTYYSAPLSPSSLPAPSTYVAPDTSQQWYEAQKAALEQARATTDEKNRRLQCINSCIVQSGGNASRCPRDNTQADATCQHQVHIQFEQCAIYTCGGDPAIFNYGH
jgi:hypothetical protein